MLLRELIADDIALVRLSEEYLLSFRVLTQVYRSYVGRLNLLSEQEIDAVVSAYGMTEAAEVFVGAVTRAHGQHAYRVWLGDTAWMEIGRRLQSAYEAVDGAITLLEPAVRPRGAARGLRVASGGVMPRPTPPYVGSELPQDIS